MAKIRDRTEDFKDAVRHIAISLGYNEVKILIFLLLFYSFASSNYSFLLISMVLNLELWLLFDRPDWQLLWRLLLFINHGKDHRLLELLLKRYVWCCHSARHCLFMLTLFFILFILGWSFEFFCCFINKRSILGCTYKLYMTGWLTLFFWLVHLVYVLAWKHWSIRTVYVEA